MPEHNHDDIFMDLDRLFKKAEKLGDRISNLEYDTIRILQSDVNALESKVRDLENKVSNLERGY